MSTNDAAALPPIPLRRVHGETALLVISLVISILLWASLALLAVASPGIGVVVLLYLLVIGAVYFIARVGLVTYVRGNGARLGPEQFPEIHQRVAVIAARMGMKRVPAAYLMQAGGALNALAARFIWRSMIVLYSDLIEACGDNAAARDMIIGHELAHVRAGHLRIRWLLFPSMIVPFLAPALSRAREYTCDLAGSAAAGDQDGAVRGLAILSVGGRFAPRLAHAALAAQRRELNTGWMTLGQCFASHPPLAKRVAALDPSLSPETRSAAGGVLRALAIVLVFVVGVGAAAVAGAYFATQGALGSLGRLLGLGSSLDMDSSFDSLDSSSLDEYSWTPSDTAAEDLAAAFAAVGAVLDEEVAAGGTLPADYEELLTLWSARTDQQIPSDPYDGMELGYELTDDGYVLWSSGPDAEPETEDDITFYGPAQQ